MHCVIYAIDFGTTNSLLGAAIPGGKSQASIPLDLGAPDPTILRSVMFFPSRSKVYYGSEAIREFTHHDMEGRLIRSIKRFLPIRSFIGTYIEDRPMNLEDIIAAFLGEMRRRANAHFQADVDSVMLGRPARFTPNGEDDTFAQYRLERAARIAGFKHIEFCPEPVAAAHEFVSGLERECTVLVGDFGGGTSDFTVMKYAPGGKSKLLSIGGVAQAGDAYDGSIMRGRISSHFGADVKYKVPFGSNELTMPIHLMEKLCSPAEMSVLRKRDTLEFFRNVRTWSLGDEDRHRMDQLFALIEDQASFDVFEEIERVKRALSDATQEPFEFHKSGIEISEKIRRKEFEEYSQKINQAILDSLDQTLKDAALKPAEIDLICMTGGTARVAALREGFEQRFGAEKVRQHRRFHSVADGLVKVAESLLT
jgi:hypothetical chaperone protein